MLQVSLTRLIERFRQREERTASISRLRQYVHRWLQWHHSRLRGWTARGLVIQIITSNIKSDFPYQILDRPAPAHQMGFQYYLEYY